MIRLVVQCEVAVTVTAVVAILIGSLGMAPSYCRSFSQRAGSTAIGRPSVP